jgi:hypothetical protein
MLRAGILGSGGQQEAMYACDKGWGWRRQPPKYNFGVRRATARPGRCSTRPPPWVRNKLLQWPHMAFQRLTGAVRGSIASTAALTRSASLAAHTQRAA